MSTLAMPAVPATGDGEAICSLCPAVRDVILAGLDKAFGLAVGQVLPEAMCALLRSQDALKIRVLDAVEAVRVDHVPDRLTIHLDADGRVARLVCG